MRRKRKPPKLKPPKWRVRKVGGEWVAVRGAKVWFAGTWREAVTYAVIAAEGENPTKPTIPVNHLPFHWRREII